MYQAGRVHKIKITKRKRKAKLISQNARFSRRENYVYASLLRNFQFIKS